MFGLGSGSAGLEQSRYLRSNRSCEHTQRPHLHKESSVRAHKVLLSQSFTDKVLPEYTVHRSLGKRQAVGSSVTLWAMFRKENLGSFHPCGCYFDANHPDKQCWRPCTPMEKVFPDGCGLVQLHNNEFEVFTWSPNSPDLNPSVGCTGSTEPPPYRT